MVVQVVVWAPQAETEDLQVISTKIVVQAQEELLCLESEVEVIIQTWVVLTRIQQSVLSGNWVVALTTMVDQAVYLKWVALEEVLVEALVV